MATLHTAAAALLLVFGLGGAAAQPASQDRWIAAGSSAADPVASGKRFDLAFGPDQFPVLASVDSVNARLHLKKWNGESWTSLSGLTASGELLNQVKMASNWAGDIVLAVLSSTAAGGGFAIRLHRLSGGQLTQVGPAIQISSEVNGYAVTLDARGPVVAWRAAGFVTVRRWSGTRWIQLGPNVNESFITFNEPRSPALAVTGDGKLVVAYSTGIGDGIGVVAKVWNGTGWIALGQSVPPPSSSPSLGGEDGGRPVVAFRNVLVPQVSRWNGTAWTPPGRPCVPPPQGRTFGDPSLAVHGSQPMVVCGILTNTTVILGRRTLVARTLSPLFAGGWVPLGAGTINGDIALANDNDLTFVVRSDLRGRPWVAWTARGSAGPSVIVSTLVPIGSAFQP